VAGAITKGMSGLMTYMMLVGCVVLFVGSLQSVFAAGVVQAADGMGLGCESAEEYQRSKMSAYRVESSTISLLQQKNIVIRAKIEAAQCRKFGENRYEWVLVNPLKKVRFEHEHYDFDTGQFSIKKIIVEPKNVRMLAIDNDFNLLAEGSVTGSMSQGFYSPMSIPIDQLVSDDQHKFIAAGGTRSFRVGIFLKSKLRHIVEGEGSEEEPAAYEESGASAMFYVTFSIRKISGEYRLL
jgi:hypothetical protein